MGPIDSAFVLSFMAWTTTFQLLKPLSFDFTAKNPGDDVGQLLGSLLWGEIEMAMGVVRIGPHLTLMDDLAGNDEWPARAASFFLGYLLLLFISHRKGPAFPRIEH